MQSLGEKLAIVILAAGASSRMRGADKLLQPIDGTPLLVLMASRALQVTDQVLVTLPCSPLGERRQQELSDLKRLTFVEVPDSERGMSRSFRSAIACIPSWVTTLLVLPGDMPDIMSDDMMRVACAIDPSSDKTIARGYGSDGTPGHPVAFAKPHFAELALLDGDKGARDVLRTHARKVAKVILPGENATTDLDTPEAWAAWRAARGKPG
ncbi:MAG: nucleotidyltransferase family protein [Pseudomonadota bacterium]